MWCETPRKKNDFQSRAPTRAGRLLEPTSPCRRHLPRAGQKKQSRLGPPAVQRCPRRPPSGATEASPRYDRSARLTDATARPRQPRRGTREGSTGRQGHCRPAGAPRRRAQEGSKDQATMGLTEMLAAAKEREANAGSMSAAAAAPAPAAASWPRPRRRPARSRGHRRRGAPQKLLGLGRQAPAWRSTRSRAAGPRWRASRRRRARSRTSRRRGRRRRQSPRNGGSGRRFPGFWLSCSTSRSWRRTSPARTRRLLLPAQPRGPVPRQRVRAELRLRRHRRFAQIEVWLRDVVAGYASHAPAADVARQARRPRLLADGVTMRVGLVRVRVVRARAATARRWRRLTLPDGTKLDRTTATVFGLKLARQTEL